MNRVINLLLTTSSASGFVSSPLRLHRQVVARYSTNELFSSPSFFPIELVDTQGPDACSKCIRFADDDTEATATILENIDPTAWAANPSQSDSGGIFLSYLPRNKNTSSVDVKLGDFALSRGHKEDHIQWLACAWIKCSVGIFFMDTGEESALN